MQKKREPRVLHNTTELSQSALPMIRRKGIPIARVSYWVWKSKLEIFSLFFLQFSDQIKGLFNWIGVENSFVPKNTDFPINRSKPENCRAQGGKSPKLV